MCRTGMCLFGIGNWIFLVACLLFTYVEGSEDLDPGLIFSTEPQDAVVLEGDSVTLSCVVTSRHSPKVSWRHSVNGSPTRDHGISFGDKHRRQLANGSLVVEKMSASLAGEYQCVATAGGIGTIVSRLATVFLAELPLLIPGPRSVLTAVGDTALLTCTMRSVDPRVALRVQPLSSSPPDRRVYGSTRVHYSPPTLKVNVTWLKNGSPLRLETGRVSLAGSGALELDALRPHDQGLYACRVAIDANTFTTGAPTELVVSTETATVESPPRFIATPHPLTVLEGASATFDCAATGNPKPEITWLNNGIAIDLSDLDSRLYLWGAGSLRVQSARAPDAGAYTCRAGNRRDSADHSAALLVLTPPRVSLPAGRVVSAHARGDVTLRCDARGRPPPAVSWLKDGEPITPNNHDIAIVDGTSLRIQGVLRVDAGMFSCSARSRAGHAQASLRLLVLPPSDEPRLAELPQNASAVAAPATLRAVLVKHRFVTLSWQEPDTRSEELLGYAVVYRVKGSERERVSLGNAQRHEMNLPSLPNTTYQFSVLAYTEHAMSPPSETIEVTTPEEELTYGPPRNVKVEAVGPHALRVTWAAPETDAPEPTKYQIHCSEVDSNRDQVQLVDVSPSTPLTATIGGLRAAGHYIIRVSAEGGAPSPDVAASTPSDAPSAPPANVTAMASGANSILVRWDAPPLRTHRGSLTGYKVRYRALAPTTTTATRRKADSLTTPADARKAELRNLATATTYQIRVCAINVNGSGPFSEWVTASTQQQQLDESRVPGKPPPLTTRAGRNWISVWWSDEVVSTPEVVVRSYWLGWGLGVPDEHQRQLPHHQHSSVIHSLEPNSEYVISLRAANSLGPGPPVYATVRTKPPAAEGDDLEEEEEDDERGELDEEEEEDAPPLIPPVGLKAIMLSGTTAVVYWTDPTLSKGQAVTDGRRYVVRWAAAGGARAKTFNATDLNCMLDDLKPYTTYEFAVKLIKGGRESPWSMLASNTSLETAPSSAPREARVSATASARAAELSWAPPARPNGRLTGYVIMYAIQRSGAEEWIAVSVPGDRTRARVDRLRPRTTYNFKIQAKNSKGLGPFSQPVSYTTAMESGEGGGLASATSAWLWASAGGACAVLALAAALALSLCCRRAQPPLSPDTSTYQKSSASAAIKPPDLWIHHDQMELKHMDKSLHSSASKISAGSTEGSALVASTLTLGRAPAAEYEPARMQHPPASLDRRHYVPTYVDRRSPSCAGSDETRASPASALYDKYRCDRCEYKPMTGVGVGLGGAGAGAGAGGGCASTCDRRHRAPHPDQSTPLLAGVGSPQSSLASLHPQLGQHPPPAPCGSGACALGGACAAPAGGDIYACAARERGHYVAYEPLGHYTHRDSLSSEAPAPAGSLQRPRAPAGLHSFALQDPSSDHSTPSHSRGSVRETSPYKKSASSSPGHIPNRLQLGAGVPHCAEELEPLTPSRSTERLHREMQNLEGLMKDLSAITQQQFHC
ncbi:neogenin isoform X3 [Plodia interpunctella]|uniref:neogenin isoform X3 n=1 Tax=Plodia interpunctella TaxID=58824 RepID=UPI0023688B74|nr:neogenin isoform X3 [Plodia interpunctella]